jgi:nitrile hydratase accessory protein
VSDRSDPLASALLTKALPICVDGDMKFSEPWEAKAFAIIVKMAQSGYFTWADWVECFSKEVAAATAVEVGGGKAKTYYEQWLTAAEKLMIEKGITSQAQLSAKKFAIGAAGTAHVLK